MKYIIFSFFIFSFLTSNAQETGLSFTIDGKIIDQQLNVYNNITVDISSTLNILTDFVPGIIYYKKGDVDYIDLKLSAGSFLYKESDKKEELVELEGINSFKIAADSFLVISQLELFPEKSKEKFLVFGFLDETEKYLLFMHQNGTSENYYLKDKSSNQWIDCNIMGKEFFQKKIIVKHFYTLPIIARPKGFARADMPQVFKMQKFYEHFQRKEKVFFNVGMEESINPEEANQFATIDNVNHDGSWEFTFFSITGNKTMHGSFSSIFPFNREGDFEWYYPNGNLRAKGKFKKDKLKGTLTTYYKNDLIQGVYKPIGKNDLALFEELYDAKGNLIKDSEFQYLSIADEFRNANLLVTLKDRILTTVVANKQNGSTYLLPSSSSKFKEKEELVYPKRAFEQGISGIVILRINLNESGIIEDKSIVFSSHKILQEAVLEYLSTEKNYKFSPGKLKGQKIKTEFLFFVRFDIVSNYINQYNGYWMNPALMQQHHYYLENINPPTVPKIQWQK